jgi:hypothetical protein
MKALTNSRMICYYDDESRLPLAVAEFRKEDGKTWLMFVLVGRTTPAGTGTRFIGRIKKKRRSFWLRTQWENIAMFKCALNAGMRLAGTDDYGFIFNSQKCGTKKGCK